MTSEKSKTNKKWTSTEEFRANHDRIFSKRHEPMKFQTINGWTKEGMKSAIRAGNNGKKAVNHPPHLGSCCYLTPDGNKCAVGCFIPDGHPSQGSVMNAIFLIHEFPDLASLMPLPVLGLRQMQEVHDGHTSARDMRDVLCEWIDENVEDGK